MTARGSAALQRRADFSMLHHSVAQRTHGSCAPVSSSHWCNFLRFDDMDVIEGTMPCGRLRGAVSSIVEWSGIFARSGGCSSPSDGPAVQALHKSACVAWKEHDHDQQDIRRIHL